MEPSLDCELVAAQLSTLDSLRGQTLLLLQHASGCESCDHLLVGLWSSLSSEVSEEIRQSPEWEKRVRATAHNVLKRCKQGS